MVFVWLFLAAGLVVGVLAFLAYRNRKPNSLEAGLRDFRRGLDALDPANDPLKKAKADGRGPFDPNGPRGSGTDKRR